MSTTKARCTIYLRDTRALDDLVEECRRAVAIEARGVISRSTAIEAAVTLALGELRANGKESAVLAALVTLPRATDGNGQDDAAGGAQ